LVNLELDLEIGMLYINGIFTSAYVLLVLKELTVNQKKKKKE
jgi:hypothetical protein